MGRLRSQDGMVQYIGIIAALGITLLLTVTVLKSSFGGAGGSGGAIDDPAAQGEVQHAFAALQVCGRNQGGNYSGCGVSQIVQNEPTLMPVRGHLSAGGAGVAAQVSAKAKTGNSFTIAVNNGAISRTCTVAGQGACPATGRW